MTKDELISLAKQTATTHGLNPALVCAIVEQESDWNTYALRYEPAFYQKYIMPIRNLTATEAYGRAFSWGLLQIMAEVAREEGFTGDIPSLCDPHIGLDAGCKHLVRKLAQAEGNTAKALLLWNGGAAPDYPAEVLARVAKYQ